VLGERNFKKGHFYHFTAFKKDQKPTKGRDPYKNDSKLNYLLITEIWFDE